MHRARQALATSETEHHVRKSKQTEARSSDPKEQPHSLAVRGTRKGVSPICCFLRSQNGGRWGTQWTAAPSHLPPWQASKFSTNWGWSADLKTGPATLGQGLAKAGSANPGCSSVQRPCYSRAACPGRGRVREEVQLLDTISTFLLISEWLPAR